MRQLISVPRRLRLVLGVACLLILAGTQPLWAIFTIQYNGTRAQFSGVSNPSGLALDLAGNLYIADTGNHRILKVPAGTTTPVLFSITIGGAPVAFSGSSPNQLAVDSSGTLFITDPASNRVIRSDPSGNGTVLGTGAISLSGPKGVAVDTFGDVFISDTGHNRIVEIPSGGSAAVLTVNGIGTLNTPKGLATDTFNNLYVADSLNNRVIKVNPSLMGSVLGISGLSNPAAVAVQNNGTIYVVDGQAAPNDRIAILDPQGDQYDMFNDEIDDAFGQPTAIAIDAQGGFYLTTVNAVNLFHQGNAGFGHVALGSSGTPITLNFDIGFFTQITGVAISKAGTQNPDFTITANAGTPCSTAIDTTGGTVRCTVNVRFTPTATGLRRGALVLSYSNEFFAPQTTGSFTVPLFGIGDGPAVALSPGIASQLSTGSLSFPSAFRPFQTAFDGVGNIYATDTDNNRILRIPAGGGAATVVSIPALPSSPTGLSGPTGLAIDGAGNLFISDTGHNRIVEVTSSGKSQVVVACLVPASSLPPLCATSQDYSFNSPKSLFIDGAGNLIVDDAGNNKIVQLTTNYALSNDNTLGFTNAFVLSTGTFVFGANSSMAVDSSGSLYISDDTNNRIIKVDRLGNSSLVDFSSLPGGLSTPHSVALDPMGNLYVMDAGGNAGSSRVIRKVMSGDTSVLAFSGTSLGSAPNQIAVDNRGNVLVADYTSSSTNGRLVQINVGQSALPFVSPVQKGSSSTESLTATVTNLGNQPLVFSANPSYTANFSHDTSDTNPCTSGTSLATGMNCNVAIKFTPESVGSLSANITVTNNTQNTANSTQQIAVSGTATNPADTTSVTVTPTPSSVKLGQGVTLTATVADTTTGHSVNIPTGSVSFTDTVGSTMVSLNGGNPVTLDGTGKAVLSGVMLSGVGTHTITASYLGVTDSYLASDNTTTATVNQADATLTGPAQPLAVTVGQAGSANVTVTGVTGIAVPNGTITYSLLNASNASVVSGSLALTAGASNATASVQLANTLAAGNYTVSVTYNGDSNYAASATPVSISVVIGKITQAALAVTGMPTSSQAYGATFTVGSSGGSGTGAVTFAAMGACSVDASSGTVTMTSGTGSCSVTVTKAADANYLIATSTAATVTASKATASLTLSSPLNLALVGDAVTFTTTAPSKATGTVDFYDGTTRLASVPLSQAVAIFTTSSLAAGTHSITASYSGDNNFQSATSAALLQNVTDYTVLGGTGNGGSGSTAVPTQTVQPGGTATYNVQVAPSVGTTLPADLVLTVTHNLPAGSTAVLTASGIANSGSTVVLLGGKAVPAVQLIVHVSSRTAALHRSNPLSTVPFAFGFLLLPFSGKVGQAVGKRVRRSGLGLVLLLVGLAGIVGLAGCGAVNTGYSAQRNYTVTVTATSGTLSHSTNFNVIVE